MTENYNNPIGIPDLTENAECYAMASGAVLRKMECGCITFPSPVMGDQYIVVKSCDVSDYDVSGTDLSFFVRPFTQNQVKASFLVTSGSLLLSINKIIRDGITARRLKDNLSQLLK